MNILFLSINVNSKNNRDNITYSFIWKEMCQLANKGHNVYYLSNLRNNIIKDGIYVISRSLILEKNNIFRKFQNIIFAFKNLFFIFNLLKIEFKKTLYVCGTERACMKIIKKYKINIIHTHFFMPDGEAAVLSARKYRVPVVATLRGAELYDMPKIDYGACRSEFYKTSLCNSIKYIDYITCPNKYLVEKLMSEFNYSQEKIRYVPNGVENMHTVKNKYHADNEVLFISICKLIKRKNLDIVLQTMIDLNQKYKFKYIIVGSGPLKQKYENILNNYNVIHNITIYDEMPKNKLYKLLSQCDCLINASLAEGMPNVVLESLAIGIPCLVSNIPGHNEVVQVGYNGFMFDPYSKHDLMNKMQHILYDITILNNMKKNCINSAKYFAIESKIDKYISIYDALLKKDTKN
ncbi:MAG: glycosyltransferase family 4 protein [bacterium]